MLNLCCDEALDRRGGDYSAAGMGSTHTKVNSSRTFAETSAAAVANRVDDSSTPRKEVISSSRAQHALSTIAGEQWG